MKKGSLIAVVVFLAACAPTGADREASQRIIRENEHRIASLEDSVHELNSQVEQLNNRVYEVRTRSGQKTSMTVVPIGHQDQAAPQPKAVPQGRKVNPAPVKAPAKAAPKAAVKTAPKAAASGSIGSGARPAGGQPAVSGDLALPPADLPPARDLPADSGAVPPAPQGNVSHEAGGAGSPAQAAARTGESAGAVPPVPQGNTRDEAVGSPPVPLLPAEDLSLPPEQQAQQPAPAPRTAKLQPAKKVSARQGEKAEYNAALSAARSGRTAEGIRKFQAFLQKYPDGPYAANAAYWIGECLYSQGKYKEALNEFQSVNSSYPSHHKNADALLKAGITLSKMGDKDGAAEKFKNLFDRFPNSEAARRARAMGAR